MKLSKKSVFSKNSYTSTIQSKNYKEKNKKIGGLKMVIHNFSELLINVAYDLNKNNATLELNFMEMGEFIDKYLILHLDKDILKRINFKHKYIISKGDYIESLNYNNLLKLLLLNLNLIYDKMNKTDLKNFSFYKSNEKDFETVKKRLINYFKGGI